MTPPTLEHELLDPEFLQALVTDGIVELSNCAYPKTHAMRTRPFFDMDGQLCCSICRQLEGEEEILQDDPARPWDLAVAEVARGHE